MGEARARAGARARALRSALVRCVVSFGSEAGPWGGPTASYLIKS